MKEFLEVLETKLAEKAENAWEAHCDFMRIGERHRLYGYGDEEEFKSQFLRELAVTVLNNILP